MAAAGTVGTASRADAAFYYWQDSEPGAYQFYRPEPVIRPRRSQPHRSQPRHPAAKKDAPQKDTGAKPQAPLIIAVSINKQRVKIYDANGFFAEAPVSTGMRDHPTPMGVFSVIQKHKWHRSNIYSDAPMPYMQRITWSGIAMHAGVLPGYPASHGCIRMPNAFAIKMWNWTRLGARVLVTPGEIEPESFSHFLLPSMKTQPHPSVATDTASDAPLGAKADKGTPASGPESEEPKLDLRSTVGHSDAVPPAKADDPQLDEKTRTADAGRDAKKGEAPVTMSDVSASKDDVAVDLAKPAPKPQARTPEAETGGSADTTPNQNDAAANPEKSAGSKAAETDAKPDGNESKQEDPPNAATSKDPVKAKAAAVTAAEPAKVEAVKSDQKPVTITDAPEDPSKDQTRLPDAAKAAAAKAETAKRAGPISVLISLKDSKLFVRQNFAPLFDSPVSIGPSDRPLGTHVFTAEVDKNDPNVLRWTVTSLPASTRSMARQEDGRAARRRGAPVEAKPRPLADSPAEALDRITIPTDVMARIADALTTGSSIIVSDQGINQGETGEGTDFIVSLR